MADRMLDSTLEFVRMLEIETDSYEIERDRFVDPFRWDILGKPGSGFHEGDAQPKSHALAFLLKGDPLTELHGLYEGDMLRKFLSSSSFDTLLGKPNSLPKFLSGFHALLGKSRSALLGKPRSGFHEGDAQPKALALLLKGDPLTELHGLYEGDTLCKFLSSSSFDTLLGKPNPLPKFLSGSHALLGKSRGGFLEGDPLPKFLSSHALAFLKGDPLPEFLGLHEGDPLPKLLVLLLTIPNGLFYAIRSNQGESLGSGGRAGEETVEEGMEIKE